MCAAPSGRLLTSNVWNAEFSARTDSPCLQSRGHKPFAIKTVHRSPPASLLYPNADCRPIVRTLVFQPALRRRAVRALSPVMRSSMDFLRGRLSSRGETVLKISRISVSCSKVSGRILIRLVPLKTLVQTIATCWWRKARLLRAENGEICKRLDTAKVDHAWRVSDEANLGLAIAENGLPLFDHNDRNLPPRDRWVILQRAQTSLRGHPASLQFLAGLLRLAKSQLRTDGQISKRVRERLSLAFGFWEPTFALSCLNANVDAAKQKKTQQTNGKGRHPMPRRRSHMTRFCVGCY